ncbi:nuclear pore complex protein NUP133 isoform X1 [Typha latifolia]|uniref:nuclear pore complex protein NUP133 isoform X1 n=2 Tax=Typha latifolia TaxID=4733 RepID=UPI003C2B21B3
MFSPATRKPYLPSRTEGNLRHQSPSTPLPSIHNRSITGTPAPWTSSRLSVLARIPTVKKAEKGGDSDQIQPVYVGEFPQNVRNAQATLLQKNLSEDTVLAGGMDKGSSTVWMICGTELFIWSYLSGSVSKQCVVLEVPSSVIGSKDLYQKLLHSHNWIVCIVRWDNASSAKSELAPEKCSSLGIILCNRITQAIAYWPDIFTKSGTDPVVSLPTQFNQNVLISDDGKASEWNPEQIHIGNDYVSEDYRFNSMIAASVHGNHHECIAIACQSIGALWLFQFTPTEIHRRRICEDISAGASTSHSQSSKGYARALIWQSKHALSEKSGGHFLLLTNREIQSWSVMLAPIIDVAKLWAREIVGNDGDLGIKKDLAGQKSIWLLDMQIDEREKELSILVATLCKDRASSSSYTQYSLLTMQYKSNQLLSSSSEHSGLNSERFLEKKAPLHIIIPKGRVEDEAFLFSMRLRVGGKPSGSAIVLSGDGTATVTHYWRGSTRLYQFDLPWDAGKVLDASIIPSAEDSEEGAWVVLTEKAGVWAVPEKAVLLGGVEPPERSLSRKGSSKEGVAEEGKRSQTFGDNIVPRRASSEAWTTRDRQRPVLTGIAQGTVLDEEAEALLGRLFHDFVLSGEVESAFEKLKIKGAFEKEGETNVFVRMSKSIVDTLAKHWTTTRGADFLSSAVVSSLLLDKHQKHQKYLQFLALSKCHGELSLKQRRSLLIIMEHGEKLSGMIQLRKLQNMLTQQRSNLVASPPSTLQPQTAGSLWYLILLVGEKARRNTVLLMDRDNAEVFYSKISDMEDLFNCLYHHLQDIIDGEQPFLVQMQQAFELSNACVTVIQTAIRFRDEHKNWYPSPEGLTPWNSHLLVRSGLWSIASFVMVLLKEAGSIDVSVKSELGSQLEGLTDVLLEAYTSSITAKIERGEEYKGLLEEYTKRRDELLGALYDFAKRVVEEKYQESSKGVDDLELKESIFREITSPILLLAKRHEGYQTLWHICYDLSDTGLLRNLMHDSIGPHGGFSYFVFRQLIKSRQYAKLLRLGEEFQDQLASFLKERKDLLWLHEMFLNQFSAASETLHELALFVSDGSPLISEEDFDLARAKRLTSLAERRRLLNLSKIAAVAGKDVGFEMKIGRIDADLQILRLQEEIALHLFSNAEEQEINKPLPPGELIELCLKGGRDLSLKAFEVFAWTSSSFRSSNRSLLEECWRNAADQDDWLALSQASIAEGWSDEVVLGSLRGTVLFNASDQCYGPEAEVYEGSFEEILPLQKDHVRAPSLKDANSSVEQILMQHKDFPEAGKLMLTAIMMDKEGTNALAEDAAMAS